MDDFDREYRMPVFENEDDEPQTGESRWLSGWHRSKRNPNNVCRFIKGIGLVTVFEQDGGYKFVAGGQFSRLYLTQIDAQLAAKALKP